MLSRRSLLKSLPVGFLSSNLFGSSKNPNWNKTLIMVEIKGGWDGLNVIAPHADNLYYKARPNIALNKEDLLLLDNDLSMNKDLSDIHKMFIDKECACVLGLGYDNPNFSHFRSIDIWHTGSNSEDKLSEGWLSSIFSNNNPPSNFMADGVIIGKGDAGPLRSKNEIIRSIVMDNPDEFINKGQDAKISSKITSKGALAHILGVENDLANAVSVLKKKLVNVNTTFQFPETNIGNQFEIAAKMISSDVKFSSIKVSQGGYDTHSGQSMRLSNLLTDLNNAISVFCNEMKSSGKWDDVLIMTYSEFGRRVKENGSYGTDHGTAAPHFLIGGSVDGGKFFGRQPSLNDLNRDNLKYTLDYRCMYEEVITNFWNLDSHYSKLNSKIKPINCLKS